MKFIRAIASEPISVVSSRWLWAARCFALICTIALGVGFVADAAAHGLGPALIIFGRWGSINLALLYLLFRRGKNSLAFALGLGAATAFIALLALASPELARISEVLRHVLFILVIFSGVLPPFSGLLLWLFGISSAMLGLSTIVAFQKMAHEATGMGKLRFAFWVGICCAPALWLIFMLLWLLLIGSFRI
jgi:hypothetical protein